MGDGQERLASDLSEDGVLHLLRSAADINRTSAAAAQPKRSLWQVAGTIRASIAMIANEILRDCGIEGLAL